MTQEKKEKKVPEVLRVEFEEGLRGAVHIERAYVPNVLTADGKIDRRLVFQLGRHAEEEREFILIADGKEVARLTHGEKQWVAKLYENGEEQAEKRYDRTETKKARRAGSNAPATRDLGPDLLSAVNNVARELWPEMKSTSRGGKGTPRKKKEEIAAELESEQQNSQRLASERDNLLKLIADQRGVPIEQVRKELLGE